MKSLRFTCMRWGLPDSVKCYMISKNFTTVQRKVCRVLISTVILMEAENVRY